MLSKIFLAVIISLNFMCGQESHNYFNVKNVLSHYQKLVDNTEFGFVDLHNSVVARIFSTGDPSAIEDTGFFVNSRWIKESGLRLIFLSIGIPRFSMQFEDTVSIKQVVSFLRTFKDYISKYQPDLVFVKTDAEAITEIKKGKICLVYALEGLNLINNDLCWIDSLYDTGVRMIGIGHNFTDQIIINNITGNTQPSFLNDSSEISDFGVQAINKLISKGILVDLAHLGQKSFWQAVKVIDNRQPLIVSHTASNSIYKNFRNITDNQVSSINESDGLIGIIFHSEYLGPDHQVGLKDFKGHFNYMKSISKENTIFIGSDLEGNILPFDNYEQVFLNNY